MITGEGGGFFGRGGRGDRGDRGGPGGPGGRSGVDILISMLDDNEALQEEIGLTPEQKATLPRFFQWFGGLKAEGPTLNDSLVPGK